MKRYDCIIVGGGPIGSFVAQEIVKRGHSVCLFEEHKVIGDPVHCAGLVSKRVLEFCKNYSKNKVLNSLYGAHIHAPSGEVLEVGGKRIHAHVIDRKNFDQYLAFEAVNQGVDLGLGQKVISSVASSGSVHCSIKNSNATALVSGKILIGADGARSRIRNIFCFPQPLEYLYGIGANVSGVDLDPRFVEILLDTRVAPGFFGWAIPTNKEGTTARIGLCVSENQRMKIKTCFSNFISHHFFKKIKIDSYIGGIIPLGPLECTADDRVMLVGDAAAQVKPTSGGGLYPGLRCAKICALVTSNALDLDRLDKRYLQNYDKTWKKEIGRELVKGMRFRSLFSHLSNIQINKVISGLNHHKIIDTITKYGDIDYPSQLILPLLKTAPSLVKMIPKILYFNK